MNIFTKKFYYEIKSDLKNSGTKVAF